MTGTLQTPRKGGRTETITIAAGTTYRVDYIGNYARCVDADADLQARIDNTGEAMLWNKGKWYRAEAGDNFVSLEFINATGAPVTLTYFVGWGTYGDDSITGQVDVEVQNTNANPVPIQEAFPDTIIPQAASTIATANHADFAANAARRLLVIYNDHATSTVWFRDQGAATAIGIPIGPKQSLSISYIGAFRVRNVSGVSVDVYVTELE